jgi:Flp pilus assembly protein TadG
MGTTQRLLTASRDRSTGRTPAAKRRGVAAVELALCLPVLLATSLGMIETCNVMFVQARMQSAAFEAARYATRPTTSTQTAATAAQVTTYANTLLTQLGVTGATVTLNPASLASAAPQSLVTVTISAPLSQNSVTSFVIASSMVLTAQATLIIE